MLSVRFPAVKRYTIHSALCELGTAGGGDAGLDLELSSLQGDLGAMRGLETQTAEEATVRPTGVARVKRFN